MTEDDAVRARIDAALREVERVEGVRILLTVESGSRAWGFPSRDSDWDVRFFYVRPLASYLSVSPSCDSIERPLLDGLDVGGWDVRKALGLLVRSNAAVLEWLASPIVHRRDERAEAELAGVARVAAHLPALEYHYDRLARGAWPPANGNPARLKALFYALRSALALAWLRRVGAPPPMDLPSLMARVAPRPDLVEAIAALRARKAAAVETDPAAQCPEMEATEAFVTEVLAVPSGTSGFSLSGQGAPTAAADAAFLRLVTEGG